MCYLLFIIYYNNAQVNLVENPSFEQVDTCPDYYGQISKAIGWDTLKAGGGSSPDLFNQCSPLQCCNTPSNYYVGYQHPNTGLGYIGLIALRYNTSSDHREYIQGKLSQKLIQGNTYNAKMHVALSYRSEYSCVPLGMYFDDGQIQSINYQVPFPYIAPQVVNTIQQLDDTLNWTIIEGSFIANGTEEYITIGNFSHRDSSEVVHSYPLLSGESSFQRSKMAYYYIDDVSVTEVNTISTLTEVQNKNEQNFILYPNPAHDKLSIINKLEIKEINLVITNVLGSVVYQNNNFNTTEIIDLVDFLGGIYFVSIENDNKIYTTKFIKY